MEELSKLCEQSSNDNCHIGVDKIKCNDEHILMLSYLIRMQPCHFEVCVEIMDVYVKFAWQKLSERKRNQRTIVY